jgi:hypothetical protein
MFPTRTGLRRHPLEDTLRVRQLARIGLGEPKLRPGSLGRTRSCRMASQRVHAPAT